MAKKEKLAAPQRNNYLFALIHGKILSIDFLLRNWITIFLVVFIIFIYITNKYQCQTRMEVIQKLERQLEVCNSEAVREKAEYMSHIRESSIQAMADSLNLGLHVQEQPPYRISLE